MERPDTADLRLLVALGVVLVLAAALLAPLRSGAFLLDDLPNLGGLERVHAEPDGAARFVSTGIAGPGGRPLALATFAVQAGDWPFAPAAFKQVNLALHLACGLALFWLFLLLGRRALPEHEARLAALAVTALWLVHPLQLSSVAYVVQRMTLLAALPMLLGLVAFVKGRQRIARDPDDPRGWLIAFGGLGVGGLVAIAAKESGGLILPAALAIDHALFDADGVAARRWRIARHALMHAPLALVAIALVVLGGDWLAAGFEGRGFTLGERALTQPRALLDYAALGLTASREGLGVFHDDFAVSRGVLTPWTTLPALIGLVAATVAAWRARRVWPLATFGVLWFLANHVLESSVLPLEPYFEHRNYLALAGVLLFPVGVWIAARRTRLRVPADAAMLAFCAWVAWQGHAEAVDWGDPMGQAARWSAEHPDSLRAQSYLANMRKVRGDAAGAAEVYLAHDARFADGVSFALDWLELGCAAGPQPLPPVATLVERARRATFSYGPSAALDRMLGRFERGQPCPRVALGDLAAINDALRANPEYVRDGYLLELLASRLARLRGDPAGARAAIRRAFDANPQPEYALVEAQWWLEAGDPTAAAEALIRARDALGPNPLRRAALEARIAALDAAIAEAREHPFPQPD